MVWQEEMEAAVAYLEAHLTEEIDLLIPARMTGFSLWSFQRAFSLVAHVPVGEYIRRRRLSCAMQDLVYGQDKVINIALRYGYESPAAFSRAFSQQYGMSPTSARNAGRVLDIYPPIIFSNKPKREDNKMTAQNDFAAYEQRGYYVQENAPVYFTPDLDKTCQWFQDVLGWYWDIADRKEDGTATYGCVYDYPGPMLLANLTPLRGFHLFCGPASEGKVIGFMMVKGLDRLHAFVTSRGWTQISEIVATPWGARECSVTTVDGAVLRFFESIS